MYERLYPVVVFVALVVAAVLFVSVVVVGVKEFQMKKEFQMEVDGSAEPEKPFELKETYCESRTIDGTYCIVCSTFHSTSVSCNWIP